MELKRCTKCVAPETHETLMFDNKGVCNICTNIDTKNTIDWDKKAIELDQLIEKYRGKYDYDCLVPFSGGKDSVWTLYYLTKIKKLKPLVVRFDHGFMRPNLEENVKKVQRILGVDIHQYTPSWNLVKKVMLQSFLDKGDFCWHCHVGIFSYPMWVALKYNVPLIFWGEPSAEYTSYYSYDQPEKVDEKRFNRFVNLGINAEDMYRRLKGTVDKRDLKYFTYPPLSELRKLQYNSVCLGSYIPWDVKKQVSVIKKELDWKGDYVENIPKKYDYEKIECSMQGVRDYIKYIKRGYTRPTHLSSIDIRMGRMTREEGLKQLSEYEGYRPPSLDLFLDFVGMTEEEFQEIAESHSVSPYNHNRDIIKPGKKTPDFDSWSKDGGMSRKESFDQINNWKKRNNK